MRIALLCKCIHPLLCEYIHPLLCEYIHPLLCEYIHPSLELNPKMTPTPKLNQSFTLTPIIRKLDAAAPNGFLVPTSTLDMKESV